MKFEKFLLDDYLQTEAGKKVCSFFSNLKDIYFNDRKKYFRKIQKFILFLLQTSEKYLKYHF